MAKLTADLILAWADAWKARTGRWPRRQDGPVPERPGLTWRAVHDALLEGHYGLPGGSSLPLLLRDRRGRRHKHQQPRLAEGQILTWADAWRRRTGAWPGVLSGEIPGTGGETWLAVNSALYFGRRGLPGGDSLRKLLRRTGRGR